MAGVAVLVAWCGGAALVALPTYAWALPNDVTVFGSIRLNDGVVVASGVAMGVLLLVIAPALTRGAARLAVRMANHLLGPRQATMLRARLDDSESGRVAAVEAAMAERQRIERDLHDGAQLRLSSVAMSLGLARTKLDTDPSLSRQLVEQAHHDVKSAMGELRDIVRGIQPAILTEQGLDAALTGLIARCPVPVERPAGLGGTRLAPTLESAAYFIVGEALANVARHANASAARVTLSCDNGALVVEVGDDGVGGAQIKPLGGIAGLQHRVSSLGGVFVVCSPHGGPTRIRATIPCES